MSSYLPWNWTDERKRRVGVPVEDEIESGSAPLLEDIITEGVRRANAGEPAIQVANDLWRRHRALWLADETAALGIDALIHRALAAGRRDDGSAENSGESAAGSGRPASAKRPNRLDALRANYEAADGTRKAFLQFTIDDARFLGNMARGREAGYRRLAEVAELAAELLVEAKASTVADLPRAQQARIAEGLRP